MKTLLLEIGTEELPISIFPKILEDMKNILAERLKAERLNFDHIKTMATPRRLAVLVTGIPETQAEKEIDIIGPPYKVAFTADNKPTKAAFGFAKKHGVSVERLVKIKTKKGEYVGLKIKEKGKPTLEILKELLPKYILSLPFPKTMRWHKSKIHFARPIHWILAILDKDVIPFSLEEIKSNNLTFGHRFMAPNPIIISHPEEYSSVLKKVFVIIDPIEREKRIINLLEKIAQEINGSPILDKDLLNWVNFLVEYPVAVRGKFDEEFLSLPEPVLITVMKQHQKCFAIRDNNGNLLPAFIAIINISVKDILPIKIGLERVIRARLADARFFYQEDLKVPLSERIIKLKDIIFQAKLGTMAEKVERLKSLATWITESLFPEKKDIILRATILCKADLTTEMVNEFPELQGIMGGIYAKAQGENETVACAISEHYLPIEAGGTLPKTIEGAILSIIDKMDTIVGCFGIGLIPTGTADPFALRRQAIGILRILFEKNISFSLFNLIELSLKTYGKFEKIKEKIISFFKTRLASLLQEKNYPYPIVEAVLSVFDGNVPSIFRKADALFKFSKTSQFEPLVIAYKRVYRIIQNPIDRTPQINLFQTPEEKKLYEKYIEVEQKIKRLLEKNDFLKALETLTILKPFIDNFFDHVLVMTEEKSLRNNRLALLTQIKKLFLKVADLSKIPI